MKKITYILPMLVVGILFLTACDNGFEEVNKNPNEPTVVPSELLLGDITRITGNTLYSTFVGGDMGACWAQQWAKVNYEDEERYKVRQSVIEGTIWKGLYEAVIADAKSMEKLAKLEGNDVSRGAALVMQAYAFSLLTEWFGDIPFSEAGRGEEGNITPKYDSQEDVYDGIFTLLDSADFYLSTGKGKLNASADLVYSGNVANWRKFANSLKFRLLMRIAHKKDVSSMLQDIVNNKPIFQSNNDDAKLNYLDAQPNANPIYESIVYGARYEYKVNSVLVNMLTSLNDPRLPVYVQKNANDEYRGKPAGIEEVPNDDYNYDNVSAIGEKYLEPTFPGFFMTYSELMFLMAEAAHMGYISGGATAAENYYLEGIRASFEFNGVEDQYDSYVGQASVAYGASTGYQKIAEQKWLALFCQGIEAWTEWRRTKYPVLSPAIDAVLPEIPSRLNYPVIEQSVNKENWEAAKNALGEDAMTAKFWWLK
jgi:hypothetical protein